MNNEGFRGIDETTATHAMDFLFSCCHELVKSREVPHCRLTSWLTFVILFVFHFLIFYFVYNQFASRSFRLQNTLHALHVTERKLQLWLSNKLKMHFSCYFFFGLQGHDTYLRNWEQCKNISQISVMSKSLSCRHVGEGHASRLSHRRHIPVALKTTDCWYWITLLREMFFDFSNAFDTIRLALLIPWHQCRWMPSRPG